ncbi:MAG: UvrD-helicase domain-containing protein, partial [Candidatus Omnitrophica bacterium]|nr:UvrD-helicase domain-containing protein [Candidatus Omnitrophota bacterium]
MDKILEGLNTEQKEAISTTEGPILIIAGAGTGKTTVITRKIAWLIANNFAKPSEILALTFTDKAAQEMQERVDILVPYGFTDVWISTFHAFGDRILRENALEVGLPLDFRVITQAECAVLMREHIFEFDLDYFRPLSEPSRFIHAFVSFFSRARDEDVSPEEYYAYANKLLKRAKENCQDKSLKEEAEKQRELASAYKNYLELLHKKGVVDFA